jgi:cellulose synthase/poly-beta-1,6-N-acetylglucosamine synthase-like glycosyltransferase
VSDSLEVLMRLIASAKERWSGPALQPAAQPMLRPLTIIDPVAADRATHTAINGLRDRSPELAAVPRLSVGQRRFLIALAGTVGIALVARPQHTLIVLVAVAIAVYTAGLVLRGDLLRLAMAGSPMLSVSDEDARAVPEDDLPVYTVLVPLYNEPAIATQLMGALAALDYPRDRLDVKVLLEVDDAATIDAIRAADGALDVELLIVPVSQPRTKPKACNFGLSRARGELVTIFDAEDLPDPLQLRKAVVAFGRHPELACLQARLSYHNPDQNMLTRWFAAEYELWFTLLLPGLASMGAPIPLGGTSNHIRRSILEDVGAWDAHNVTEDADLGVRLHRHGYRVGVLDSVTFEEANSDAINWVKQRSRWYKGYLQTWLVHLRHPRRLVAEVGWRQFIAFNLFVGGTPLLALLNPVFWAMTILWFVRQPPWVAELFPAPIYYAGTVCFVLGNVSVIYANLLGAQIARRPNLVLAALLSPIYWLLMSAAAAKATVQLIHAPSYWEKTTHGLDRRLHSAPA